MTGSAPGRSLPRALSPGVRAYLDCLPRGIDSYPHACVKGSIVRSIALAFQGDAKVRAGLPLETDRLVSDPPLQSAWIPEAHLNVLFLSIYDAHHARSGGWDSFEHWAYEGNLRIFRGPLYRILFLAMSPERVMQGALRRWAAFRRGTRLEPLEAPAAQARLRLTYEPHLMPEAGLRAVGQAFRAAADAAGAVDARITYEESSPTSTVFVARWA